MGISSSCDAIGEEIKDLTLLIEFIWSRLQTGVLEVSRHHLKLTCDVFQEGTVAWKRQLKLNSHRTAS